jgi:hypothetical protein
MLSFSFDFELFLLFSLFCRFSCYLLAFAVFPLLDDLLEIFLVFFGLLTVLHGVLDSNFKLYTFVVNGLIKGEIEKPIGPFFGLIVMSY